MDSLMYLVPNFVDLICTKPPMGRGSCPSLFRVTSDFMWQSEFRVQVIFPWPPPRRRRHNGILKLSGHLYYIVSEIWGWPPLNW